MDLGDRPACASLVPPTLAPVYCALRLGLLLRIGTGLGIAHVITARPPLAGCPGSLPRASALSL
eukprot:1312752-Lingulodinium_polyedra.AAC.1